MIFQSGTSTPKGSGNSITGLYSQIHYYGGRDTHKRGNFRGHPGGQKIEVPLAKATTLATGVPESNGKTGKLHMHTHFYSDQETGSLRRH